MAYLTTKRKEELRIASANSGGDLNYLISLVLIDYWKNNPRYQTYHEILEAQIQIERYADNLVSLNTELELRITGLLDEHGYTVVASLAALRAAIREFERRVLAPYEDQKALENGDIYG